MAAFATPFVKQCFVTLGVAANVGQFGLVMSYTAVLLPQLARQGSDIAVDQDTASWIAAAPAFALLLGNLAIPTLMARCGRKPASIVSVALVTGGWACVVCAPGVGWLLGARLLQGLSLGMSTALGPALIGEYTSPRRRGACLSSVGLSMSLMTLVAHSLGAFLSWRATALACAVLSLLNLLVVLLSPESPVWLADRGRYEDCERVFRWLRGDTDEEPELRSLIDASRRLRESEAETAAREASFGRRLKRNLVYFGSTIRKREFYKPIIIMIHMYMIANWGGINILSAYTLDTFHRLVGGEHDVAMVISMDVQRIVSNTAAIYAMRRVRRRTMLFAMLALNIAALAGTGGYSWLREHGLVARDHVVVGALLVHVHTFSVVTGSLPLPMVISGEIFPRRFKSLAGGISALFYSLNVLLTVKTVLPLYSAVELSGAYFIYAAVLTYCCVVAWFTLPETKDKTLQEIEREFKGTAPPPEDPKSAEAQSLKSLNEPAA